MLLYLIRHGESAYNAEGRIQGQTDIPLSAFGRRQSAAIAAAFSAVRLDAIYSSPLLRAAETARPLAEQQGLTPIFEPRLQEIHAGVFQGLLWSEIEQRFPEYAEPWKRQSADFVIPGGESRRQLMARGQAALEHIHIQPLRAVAVVAHGGVLAATLKALLSIPAELNPFCFYNASISRLVWRDRVQLRTLNQLDHLEKHGLAREDHTGNL
jgi:probable phosphoglycerate mutase